MKVHGGWSEPPDLSGNLTKVFVSIAYFEAAGKDKTAQGSVENFDAFVFGKWR